MNENRLLTLQNQLFPNYFKYPCKKRMSLTDDGFNTERLSSRMRAQRLNALSEGALVAGMQRTYLAR